MCQIPCLYDLQPRKQQNNIIPAFKLCKHWHLESKYLYTKLVAIYNKQCVLFFIYHIPHLRSTLNHITHTKRLVIRSKAVADWLAAALTDRHQSESKQFFKSAMCKNFSLKHWTNIQNYQGNVNKYQFGIVSKTSINVSMLTSYPRHY